MKAESTRLYNDTGYAVVAPVGVSISEKGIKDFGYEEWLVRILADEKLITAYLERLTESYIKLIDRYMEAVGGNIDVIQTNDDLGMQRSNHYFAGSLQEAFKIRQNRLLF